MSEDKERPDTGDTRTPWRQALRDHFIKNLHAWVLGLLTLTAGVVYKCIDTETGINAQFREAIGNLSSADKQANGVGDLARLLRAGSLDHSMKLDARQAILQMIVRDDARSSSVSACTTKPAPQHFKQAVALLAWLKDTRNRGDAIALNGANVNGVVFDTLDLRRWTFRYACLAGASFRRSALDGARFDGADMSGGLLFGASVKGASFNQGAVLSRARLDSVHGDSVMFHEAELVGANFTGARIRFAIFRGANLKCAMLIGAILDSADFADAVMDGADLRGADTTGVRNLDLVASSTSVLFPGSKSIPRGRGREAVCQ